ncbi:MAG: septum formation initiator family protein [Alphaproteobacteria bacterium]|nr:septum formation initiator family protein [Alphaproteobacteria bacterium]
MAFDTLITGDKIKHGLVIGVCVAIVAYFVSHGIMGERGFISLSQVEYQIAGAKGDLEKIQKERQTLEARTKLLRPDGLDLDMLDERARATLGYTKPNEYVVLFEKKK